MKEYIEREQAIALFYPVDPENDGSDGCTIVYKSGNFSSSEIEAMLLDLPAADVAEVVHGRWILHHTVTGNPYTECSNCCTNVAVKTDKGTSAKLDMRGMPYCPFCSAKMDGGFDDATS